MTHAIADIADIADPVFERFAQLVREALGVPMAFVSLVMIDAQVMPGMAGMDEGRFGRRAPLSQSICQYVVADNSPVVIGDARADDRSAASAAIEDLHLLAYAGYPLRDEGGDAIGTVCAMDTHPRSWTEKDLAVLQSIADVCSTEMALRQAKSELQRSVNRTDVISRRLQLLLGLSEMLSRAVTPVDVARAVHVLASTHLRAQHAGVWMLTPGPGGVVAMRHVSVRDAPWQQADRHTTLPPDQDNPVGAALTARGGLFFPDRATQNDLFPALDTTGSDAEARAMLPMRVGDSHVGTLVLTWEGPRRFTDDERVIMTALTTYAALAAQRTALLAERASAARTLQSALFAAELPRVPGIALAARYVGATGFDEIGGDWYDVAVTPGGTPELVVGDVAGHDVSAAVDMGSIRNILKTLAWVDGATPAEILSRLDGACRRFGIKRHATLVYGRLVEEPDTRRRRFEYANAGHLAPVVIRPGGVAHVARAQECDLPVNVEMGCERQTHVLVVEPGDTLLLFTDGLVERRDCPVDLGLDRLTTVLERHGDDDVEDMVDAIVDELLGNEVEDDVAVLAVRVGTGAHDS